MTGVTFNIGSAVLLAVSLIGNWEQHRELDIRSTQIEELKWENQALVNKAHLSQEQLMKLRKEYEHTSEQNVQLVKDLTKLHSRKDAAERDVAVYREQLRREVREDRRMQLEKDLAKANGKLEIQEQMIRDKVADIAETRAHLHNLSMNQCGSFTPQGLLEMVNGWANVSPLTISILGNICFSAAAAFLWRLFMYSHKSGPYVALPEHEQQMRVPIYNWWPVYWIRKLVTWVVAFLALSILPVLLKDFAGRKAMESMEAARSSFCEGAPWCAWSFDTFLTPNAILIAEGEAYVHAARGWQRVVIAQVLALVADRIMVVVICALAFPLRRQGYRLLQSNEKAVGVAMGEGSACGELADEEDDGDEEQDAEED